MPQRQHRHQQGWQAGGGAGGWDLFAHIHRLRERFDALSGCIAQACAEVSAEQGLAEIDAVVAAGRKRK